LEERQVSRVVHIELDKSFDKKVVIELLSGLTMPLLKASGLDDAAIVHMEPVGEVERYQIVFSSKEEPEVKE
jgi:hypothetical protein